MAKREIEMSEEAPMYIYATEGVSSYYSILKINNKKILTICGSGDQVLNAYFFGAKEVVGFDLNKRSEFITRIKIAAIKELNYKEFLKFFGKNYTSASLDYGLYRKIQKNLDKKTIAFFNSLYKKCNFKGKKLVKSEYFRQREDVRLDIKKINLYLKNERTYLKLRHILKNIKFKFVQGNVKDIYTNKRLINEKFNILNLSNVPNYFTVKFERENARDPIMTFFREILLNLRKKLSPKGIIFYYAYSAQIYPNRVAKKMPLLSKNLSTKRIAKQKEFKVTIKRFETYKGFFDKIIILKRH